ncbi:uncharacterized protein METZ01_LOCUS242035, partial [marine metagenome]
GSTITWYRNEEEQSQFANENTIPNDVTSCFDIWYAEVVPFDGTASGDTTISNYVDICSANTPPAWADIQDQHINEDSGENILSMVGLITDESIVDLEFNVVLNSDTTNLSANFYGTDLVLIPRIENYNSTTPVEMILSASDGQYLMFTDYIYIFIDPLNDPPVLNAIADQNTNEDTQLTMNLSGVDVDGDNLSFSAASGDTSLINVLVFANQLTLIPEDNRFGSVDISVTVSDGLLTESAIFTLTVTPVNDEPVLSEIGLNTCPEDISLITTLSSSDIDGDDLTYIAESYSANVSVNVDGDQLTMTPVQDFNGTAQIEVTVSDGFLTDGEIFQLSVTAVNDAPILTEIGSQDTDEDIPLVIDLVASDIDGDILSYTVESGDENVTVSLSNNLLTLTPLENWNGSSNISVTVSDSSLNDAEVFDLIVNAVNDPPNAGDDAAIVLEDNSVDGNVLENDSDLDADF